MKKIGYVIYSENHKNDFAKGFLNKSRHLLSQTMQGLIPPWKASSFYDDRLNELGIIIAVGKVNFENDKAMEDVWTQILDLCRKQKIEAVCAAEISLPTVYIGETIPIFNDDSSLFIYKYVNGLLNGNILPNSQTALLTNKPINLNYLKYLADKQNYICIYNRNKETAQAYADAMYRYNGTAAQITDHLGTVKSSDVIIVFDEKMQTHLNYFPKNIYIVNPYFVSSEEKDRLETRIYTNKLGEMRLNASFIESMFYASYQKEPINDLILFEKIVKDRLELSSESD